MKKTVAFTRDAVNIFFHILTACNLKCRHCYINPDQHGHETLGLSYITQVLSIFSQKHENMNVVFLGGEPTMNPHLPGAVKTAVDLGYGSITIDTNGYLFNDILEKVSPAEVDYFSFSLDGASGQTNDRIRGPGSYERCLTGIRQAAAKGFSISLIYTVSGANIHELSDMGPLLKKMGVDRFFIQVIGMRGRSTGKETDIRQVSRSEWLKTVPHAAENIAARGIQVTYPKVFLEPGENFECAARVAENYFIFPNGRVYRCPVCEDFPIHSLEMVDGRLVKTPGINEEDLFKLDIPEGCVMNKLVQSGHIDHIRRESPGHKIACCLLKEEIKY